MLTPQDRLEDLFLAPEVFNKTAADLGLSPDELEEKIEGKQDFLCSEVKEIARRFQLSDRELLEIFFPQPLQKTVSQNIMALNGDEYYELKELADVIGMSYTELLYKVLNEKDFTISDIEKIAQALDQPAEYFLQRHF